MGPNSGSFLKFLFEFCGRKSNQDGATKLVENNAVALF